MAQRKAKTYRVAVRCELLFDVGARSEALAKARAERALEAIVDHEEGITLRHTLAGARLYPRFEREGAPGHRRRWGERGRQVLRRWER